VSYVLALIGSASIPRRDEAINEIVEWHLNPKHHAVWTDIERSRFAGGMRLVAKVAGAKVLVLTGTLASGDARTDPIEVDGRTLRFRYDVRWDPRPPAWVPVEDVGEPFSQPTRTMRFIDYDDWLCAYRVLHGTEPPRQDAGR
jgi:hypothetical protein